MKKIFQTLSVALAFASCSDKSGSTRSLPSSYTITKTDGRYVQTKEGLWMISPSASQTTDYSGAKQYWIYEDRTGLQTARFTTSNSAYYASDYFPGKLGYDYFWTYPKDATVTFSSVVHPDGTTRNVPQWNFAAANRSLSAKLEMPQLSYAPIDLAWKYAFTFHMQLNSSAIAKTSFHAKFTAACYAPGSTILDGSEDLESTYQIVNLNQGWNDVTIPFSFTSARYNAFAASCQSRDKIVTQSLTFESVDVASIQNLRFLGTQVVLSDLRLLGSSPAPAIKTINLPDPQKIWDIRTDCKDNANTYWLCGSKQINFAVDKASSTENMVIRSLLFVNTLAYKFSCPKVNVGLSPNQVEQVVDVFIDGQKIAPSTDTVSFDTPIPYDPTYYAFGIFPSTSANFWPECALEVVDNTTKAHTDSLRAYHRLLDMNLSFYDALTSSLREATTIQGKAAGIANLPIFLENQNEELRVNIDNLSRERDILESIANRSSYEEQRLTDVKTLIAQKQAEQIHNLQIEQDVHEALSAFEECNNDLCAQKINDLSNQLTDLFESFKTQMTQLEKFLDDEIKRLEIRSPAYADSLKNIYCMNDLNNCKYLKADGSLATWAEANAGSGSGSSGGGSSGSGNGQGGTGGSTGTGGGTQPPADDIIADGYSKQSSKTDQGKVYHYIENRPEIETESVQKVNLRYFPKNYYDKDLYQYPFWTFSASATVQFQADHAPNPTVDKLLNFASQNKAMEIGIVLNLPDFENLVTLYKNWRTTYAYSWNVNTVATSTLTIDSEIVGSCSTADQTLLDSKGIATHHASVPSTNGAWLAAESEIVIDQTSYTSFYSSCLLRLGKPTFTFRQRLASTGNVSLQFRGIDEEFFLPLNETAQQSNLTRESAETTNVSVFDVRTDCRYHQGTYNNCPNVTMNLKADTVSATPDEYIQSMLFTNRINYRFRCNKIYREGNINAVSQTVEVYFNQQKISPSSGVVTKDSPTFYQGSTTTLRATVPLQDIVWPECSYEVVSNVTFPNLNALATYKNFLRESASLYLALNREFDIAEELPAQWSVVNKLPKIVDYQILKTKQDVTYTEQQIAAIESMPNPSSENLQRLAVLRSYREELRSNLAAEENRKQSLTEIVGQTQTCQGSTDAYCLDNLVKARNVVNDYANATKEKTIYLEDFLLDEIARIQNREAQVAKLLKNYYCELRGNNCNATQSVEVLQAQQDAANPPANNIPNEVLTGGQGSIEQWKDTTVTAIESAPDFTVPMPDMIVIANPFDNYQRGVVEVDQKYDELTAEKTAGTALVLEERSLRSEIEEATSAAKTINVFLIDQQKVMDLFNGGSGEISALIPQINAAMQADNAQKLAFETWFNQAATRIFADPPPPIAELLAIESEYRSRAQNATFCFNNSAQTLALSALKIHANKIVAAQRTYRDLVEAFVLPKKYEATKDRAKSVLAKIDSETERYWQYLSGLQPLAIRPTVCDKFAALEMVINFAKESAYMKAAGSGLNQLAAKSLYEEVETAQEAVAMETSMRRYLLDLEGRFYAYLTDGKIIEAAAVSDTIRDTTSLFAYRVMNTDFWSKAQKGDFLAAIGQARQRIAARKHTDLDDIEKLNTLVAFRSGNLQALTASIDARFKGFPNMAWQDLLNWTLSTLSMRPNSPFMPPHFNDRDPLVQFDANLSELERKLVAFENYTPLSCASTQHGDMASRTRYATESVPAGSTCQLEVQQARCLNGNLEPWSGTYTFDSCMVQVPIDADNDGVADGLDECPGEDDRLIRDIYVDQDQDGLYTLLRHQCPSVIGRTVPPSPLLDDNDSSPIQNWNAKLVSEVDMGQDFDGDGQLNPYATAYALGNPVQYIKLAQACRNINNDACWANIVLIDDIDFAKLDGNPTYDEGPAGDGRLTIKKAENMLATGSDMLFWRGNLYGSNMKWKNIDVQLPTKSYVGAFAGSASLGFDWYTFIGNISLENVRVNGLSLTGGFIGYLNKVAISKVSTDAISSVTSSASSGGGYAGGIIGNAYNDSTITDCVNRASVDSNGGSYIGGIIGTMNGTIWNKASQIIRSQNHGAINGTTKANAENTGGIAGYTSYTLIENASNAGTIFGGTYTGGIAGRSQGSVVRRIKNTGPVSTANFSKASSEIGGLFGTLSPISGENVTIVNGYNEGKVNGKSIVGGLFGGIAPGTSMENLYNVGTVQINGNINGTQSICGMNYNYQDPVKFLNVFALNNSAKSHGGCYASPTELTFDAFGVAANFPFDFVNVWQMQAGQSTAASTRPVFP